jgi:hypothetical protein
MTSESCHPLGAPTIPNGMGAIAAVRCLVLDPHWSLEDPKGGRQTCGTGSNSPQIRGWCVGLGPHCIRGDINGRPMGDSSLCDEMAPRRDHTYSRVRNEMYSTDRRRSIRKNYTTPERKPKHTVSYTLFAFWKSYTRNRPRISI